MRAIEALLLDEFAVLSRPAYSIGPVPSKSPGGEAPKPGRSDRVGAPLARHRSGITGSPHPAPAPRPVEQDKRRSIALDVESDGHL